MIPYIWQIFHVHPMEKQLDISKVTCVVSGELTNVSVWDLVIYLYWSSFEWWWVSVASALNIHCKSITGAISRHDKQPLPGHDVPDNNNETLFLSQGSDPITNWLLRRKKAPSISFWRDSSFASSFASSATCWICTIQKYHCISDKRTKCAMRLMMSMLGVSLSKGGCSPQSSQSRSHGDVRWGSSSVYCVY